MELIDFTTCTVAAPGRAELLRRTYRSFEQNLIGVDMPGSRVFLNEDGVLQEDQGACQALFEASNGAMIVVRFSHVHSFPAAVRWLWQQPTTRYFLHLEDDWELRRPVNIADLIAPLDADPGLSCVNIRAYNGINDQRICLSPGLWRTEHARVIASRLTDDEDPELQLRQGAADGFRGMQWPTNRTPYIKDLGRAWMAEHGLRKNRGKRLTAWEEISCVGS